MNDSEIRKAMDMLELKRPEKALEAGDVAFLEWFLLRVEEPTKVEFEILCWMLQHPSVFVIDYQFQVTLTESAKARLT